MTVLNRSIRSVDLRIEIGEYCDFDFAQRVRESNSNSLAAIYFTRAQLDRIAVELGIDPENYARKGALQDAIRVSSGQEPRTVEGFDWVELKAIIETVDIPVDDDCYHDIHSGDESDAAPGDGSTTETGPWADWAQTELQ